MTDSATQNFSWSRLFLWLVLLSLSLFGLCYIYSTGYIGDDYPVRENWQRQAIFLLVGFALFALFSRWDNRLLSWRMMLWTGYFVSLLGLILVLLVGKEIGGARRWIQLGPFLLQPAEPAKLFTLLAACQLLSKQVKPRRFIHFVSLFAVILLPAFLIKLEPSLGNALILLPPCFVAWFVRWCPPKLLFCLLSVCFLLICAGIAGLFHIRNATESVAPSTQQQTIAKGGNGFLRGYHRKRLRSYISGRGSWNERQSIMTVASGGLHGKGYLNGTMKSLGYLPRTVAPTDFIFSVIAEEGGFLYGTLPVCLLYAALLFLCVHWGGTATNSFDATLCTAFTTHLFLHILIGIGMTIRLLPIMGLPLPLLSYGGSFTISFLAGLGCVAATRLHRNSSAPTDSGTILNLRLGRLLNFNIRRK